MDPQEYQDTQTSKTTVDKVVDRLLERGQLSSFDIKKMARQLNVKDKVIRLILGSMFSHDFLSSKIFFDRPEEASTYRVFYVTEKFLKYAEEDREIS